MSRTADDREVLDFLKQARERMPEDNGYVPSKEELALNVDVADLITTIGGYFRHTLDQVLEHYALSRDDFQVLAHFAELQVGVLSNVLDDDETLTQAASSLVERGLLARVEKGRSWWRKARVTWKVTPTGRRSLEEANSLRLSCVQDAMLGLKLEDKRALSDVLSRLSLWILVRNQPE